MLFFYLHNQIIMTTDNFYLILPSNSSMGSFPNNKISHYTTALKQPLELDGDWEVALVSIEHPSRWENISSDYCRFSAKTESGKWREGGVPPGFYSSNEDFVKALNDALYSMHNDAGMGQQPVQYNKYNEKAYMKLHPHFTVRLHDGIAQVLGYGETTTINGPDWAKPEYGVDVNHGVHSLYVYCDLVEDQIVGDSTVKVIRTIPLKHKPGVVAPLATHFHTDNPHYVPVSKRNTQTVEIHIRDDTGHDIPFIAGKVIVKLHFRLKRPHFV